MIDPGGAPSNHPPTWPQTRCQRTGRVPATRRARAINSFTRRDFAVASKEFEALRVLNPDDFALPLFLGLLALAGGDTKSLLTRLHEAEERALKNPGDD